MPAKRSDPARGEQDGQVRDESEARYRRIFDEMAEGFALHEIICDEAGRPIDYRFLDANPSFERLTGLRRQDILGKTVREVLPGEDPYWIEAYGRVALTGEPANFERHAVTLGRSYEVLAYQPAPRQVAVLFRDVTERRRIEQELRQSEQHYRTLFETMLQGVVYQDAEGKIISMNPAAVRILGKTPEEFVGETSVSVEHDTIRADGTPFPGAEHPAMLALATGRSYRDVVMGVYNPREHAYRWISITAIPLFREGEERPYQVYTLFDDITERRQAEQELARQRALLEAIAENTTNQLVYLDRDFNFLWVNPAYARACQRPRESFLGHNHFELYPHAENEAIFRRVRDTGEPASFTEKPFEFPDHPEWGVTYWDWTLTPIKGPDGRVDALVFSLVDMTAQVRARQQIAEAERARAEAAERLAAEVNHRMKNNLTLLSGLLTMQALQVAGTPAEQALRDSVSRLAALSVVHEHLYSGQSGRVDLLDVLARIADKDVSALAPRGTELTVCGEPVFTSSRLASSLAVVANELLTNAIKYGGPGPDGVLHIRLQVGRRGGRLAIGVWNSGAPVPAGFDPAAQGGMGLRLSREVVVGQLGGELAITPSEGGTRAEVSLDERVLAEDDTLPPVPA